MSKNCDSCGARLSEGLDVCDLCGTPVGGVLEAVSDSSSSKTGSSRKPLGTQGNPEGVFCNSCGWKNPGESNFCSKCGSALQKAAKKGGQAQSGHTPPSPSAEQIGQSKQADDSQKAVGRQIGIIVAAALLVVLALYAITTMSKSAKTDSASATILPNNPGVEAPLAPQFVPQQTALREKMNGLEGEALIAVQRELVDLYFAAGRFDLAAEETEIIAGSLNSENEWAVAGNLYYDWMERKEPSLRTPWAKKAVAAYQEVLKINPANLDVRTDMAIAYMYDPQNSMMAIQETNAVLEQDPDHMQANFNRGIMLMQIDRVLQAAEQFEKVMELIGDPEDEIYKRAKDLADRLRGEIATTNG